MGFTKLDAKAQKEDCAWLANYLVIRPSLHSLQVNFADIFRELDSLEDLGEIFVPIRSWLVPGFKDLSTIWYGQTNSH